MSALTSYAKAGLPPVRTALPYSGHLLTPLLQASPCPHGLARRIIRKQHTTRTQTGHFFVTQVLFFAYL